MQTLQPLFTTEPIIYSAVVVSNDSTSKLININKDTELQTFYQEISLQFPNIEDYRLFYFEGYSMKKYLITNEEEFIIANKKGIEFFYLCGNNSNNDFIDYLRYYSVMLFCPIKRLNNNFQISERKKMEKKNLQTFNSFPNPGNNNNFMNFNSNINVINNNFNINQNFPSITCNNYFINNINNITNINFNHIQLPSQIPDYETIDTEQDPVNRYIENAINYSKVMKYLIDFQNSQNPGYFINIEQTLLTPGLLYQNFPTPMDYQYILCLLGKILKNKGIKVGIYNQGYNLERIDLSAVQFIFSGLINKKKYRLKFSPNINYANIMSTLSSKKKFIQEWKTNISYMLNMDKANIILTNIRNNNTSLYLDLAFNPHVVEINDQKLINALVKGNIIKCTPAPLLAGCILSPNIFNSQFNKYYNIMVPNKIRGGEEYIHPFQWTAYGINVSGKYDFGNNIWLGNENNIGEFAVAYHGVNNLNQQILKKTDSLMGNTETGKTFVKVKNMRNPFSNCKSGVYLYKNPIHAENSSELLNIGGFEYKIMFMCRVNTPKINQPENFSDCWILSATPDEVRPYKILIKKIWKSPLFIASQGQIKICKGDPPPFYKDIITQKDESYLNGLGGFNCFNGFNNMGCNNMGFNNMGFNQNIQNKFELVLKEWTGMASSRINNYLRNHIMALPEPILKSNVWCLHKAIVKGINNVPNNTIVYRGINAKIPFDIGVGTTFYFQEFLSTSRDINIAKSFANSGTLMVISIQNNGTNGKKVYCRDIENLSNFQFEREIIFTAFCQFKVTRIDKENNLDIIYLTCDGYNF